MDRHSFRNGKALRFALFCALFLPHLLLAGPAVLPAAADEIGDDLDFLLEDDWETDSAEERPIVADPIEPWNQAMFHFNDRLYFWVLKPVATGYKTVAPEIARRGVRNFFNNLTTPVRFVSCLLQGKSERAGVELGRFMVNSTFGVLGFGTPSDLEPSLATPPPEDLGQTLGAWGIGNGFYIVWPVLGPSTLRDTIGSAGDGFLGPASYVEPMAATIGARALEQVNELSFRLGTYEDIKKAALDPYVAIRSGYIQRRDRQIRE
jgi:phospholipid-binding lipoprotein MlaA